MKNKFIELHTVKQKVEMKKIKIKQWSSSMNITKFYCVFLFSLLLTGCSVRPWRTIKFISYPIEKLSEIENFDDIETDCKIDNVFFYFVSNGIEDSIKLGVPKENIHTNTGSSWSDNSYNFLIKVLEGKNVADAYEEYKKANAEHNERLNNGN